MTPTTVKDSLVEIDGAADDFGIGAERAAPEIFAEHDDRSRAGFAVFGRECAARDGLHLEKREKSCDVTTDVLTTNGSPRPVRVS